MEVLRHCVQIILNLTQYVETARVLLSPKNVLDIYADLLQHYKDNNKIFLPVTNSLINMSNFEDTKNVMR